MARHNGLRMSWYPWGTCLAGEPQVKGWLLDICLHGVRLSGLRVFALHLCVFLPSWFPCPATSDLPPSSPRNPSHHRGRMFVSFSITSFPKVWLWVVPIPKTFPLLREKRKSFLSFSLTSLLLYYLLRSEWPTDSNGCRSEDDKKCQQFWNNNTDVSGKLENLYPATLKKIALPVC